MHLVHTRSDLADNVTRALDPDECKDKGAYCGLVVIGILFHVGSENNTVIDVNIHSFKTTTYLGPRGSTFVSVVGCWLMNHMIYLKLRQT